LEEGIKIIKPWVSLWEYGKKVYETVTSAGAHIIKPLTGHGVGEHVHEGPYVYNYPERKAQNIFFKQGMVLALEPITALTSTDFREKKWNHRNLYTTKGDLWAQREYTVVVTSGGVEVLAGVRSL
jgi:methionyl aminopeptidase